jgi:transposase
MITLPAGVRVYLACGSTDMRKGMATLAMLVQQTLGHDPFCGTVYAFRGRRGQQATFSIQFSHCQDCLSLASPVRADVAGIAPPSREGSAMYLHGRTAGP